MPKKGNRATAGTDASAKERKIKKIVLTLNLCFFYSFGQDIEKVFLLSFRKYINVYSSLSNNCADGINVQVGKFSKINKDVQAGIF